MSVQSSAWPRVIVAGIVGVVFGLGLAVAGMTDPDKVLAFLDVTGDWDPSLMLVLGSAVGLCLVAFRLILRRQHPIYDQCFALPSRSDLDSKLILGAAIFGLGWGLVGYCPGPAIASIGFGNTEALWFVPAMLAGMFVRRRFEKAEKAQVVVPTAASAQASA